MPGGGAPGRELLFSFDGTLLRAGEAPAGDAATKQFHPLGRLFVAMQAGAPAGFGVEGEGRGYKNRIRFFVALDREWNIAGVRVIEHEEDPGLGAEVATPWFQAQFAGRPFEQVGRLDVTRDPMPEDWRAALRARPGASAGDWDSRYGALQARESGHSIYAVTGATISSRALTDGVRTTILHFRRRWELLEPHLRPAE
jgi:electron transport complex protein RnfG